MKEFGVIVQARTGSTRRPGKVSHKIEGMMLLGHQLLRLIENGIENVILATTVCPSDDALVEMAKGLSIPVFRGEIDDVTKRFFDAAKHHGFVNVIRVCGDDPLVDPECVRRLVENQIEQPADYLFTTHRDGWLYGTTADLITTEAIERTITMTTDPFYREHVVTFARKDDHFRRRAISPDDNRLIRPEIFLSVDYQEDLDVVEQVLKYFGKRNKTHTFTQYELIELYDSGDLEIGNIQLHESFPTYPKTEE